MDVQTTAEATALPPLTFSAPPPPPPAPTSASTDVSSGSPSASSSNGAGAPNAGTSKNASTPPVQVPSLPPHDDNSSTLGSVVANAFNTAAENVQVSFQVDPQTKDVVIVFTDKSTGKTIVQIPSETLIALAQFFNKLAGNVLDKKA